MRFTHVNLELPAGAEDEARWFYRDLLGLREIPKPEALRDRGGVWFDAGGLDLHFSAVRGDRLPDVQRHIGLECEDVDTVSALLTGAGVSLDQGRPAPWKRIFVHDPFGNRLELHEPGVFRS